MTHENSFYGPLADPAADAGYLEHPPRVGFFTDTSVCIGCKACEVACKEWNAVPEDGLNLLGMSFDITGMLGGLQVSSDGTQTVIAGLLPDQSALHGLLARVRDLGLSLISVRQLDAGDAGDQAQQ
jgi:ferredoxin